MNLENKPSLIQFKELVASCDDNAGHHVLWASISGGVEFGVLTPELDLSPIGFENSTPSMKLRFETYSRGNGYVGFEAAKDSEYIERLYKALLAKWGERSSGARVDYIDYF
jgi:hypothetical protein